MNRIIETIGFHSSIINPNPLLSLGLNLDSNMKVWKDPAVLAILRLFGE